MSDANPTPVKEKKKKEKKKKLRAKKFRGEDKSIKTPKGAHPYVGFSTSTKGVFVKMGRAARGVRAPDDSPLKKKFSQHDLEIHTIRQMLADQRKEIVSDKLATQRAIDEAVRKAQLEIRRENARSFKIRDESRREMEGLSSQPRAPGPHFPTAPAAHVGPVSHAAPVPPVALVGHPAPITHTAPVAPTARVTPAGRSPSWTGMLDWGAAAGAGAGDEPETEPAQPMSPTTQHIAGWRTGEVTTDLTEDELIERTNLRPRSREDVSLFL